MTILPSLVTKVFHGYKSEILMLNEDLPAVSAMESYIDWEYYRPWLELGEVYNYCVFKEYGADNGLIGLTDVRDLQELIDKYNNGVVDLVVEGILLDAVSSKYPKVQIKVDF